MSGEANKAVIRQWVAEGWNGGDIDNAAQHYYAEDYRMHDPGVPGLPPGLESFKAYIHGFHDALSAVNVVIEDLLAEGDRVCWRWAMTATHTAPFLGIPATGKDIAFTGVLISRFADGKIVEEWNHFDALGFLQQIGAIPAMT